MVFHLEVFGNNDLFKQVSDIHLLEPYMYTKLVEVIPTSESVLEPPQVDTLPTPSYIPQNLSSIPLKINVNVNEVPESKIFIKSSTMPGIFPKKPDNLFWCIYIALYGYATYHEIGHRYGNIEIEEKQKLMELMRKSPTIAKQSMKKITKVLFQEIMSDFMTNKKMTMDMLTMVALYYNKNFIIAHLIESGESEPYYIKIIGDSTSETQPFLFYKRGKYDFSFMLEPEKKILEDIEKICFKYENHDMPLKAVSSYKTSDLEHIFDVLEIEREKCKKYKKEDYYKCIMIRCGYV